MENFIQLTSHLQGLVKMLLGKILQVNRNQWAGRVFLQLKNNKYSLFRILLIYGLWFECCQYLRLYGTEGLND
jgi:hypothetical protein